MNCIKGHEGIWGSNKGSNICLPGHYKWGGAPDKVANITSPLISDGMERPTREEEADTDQQIAWVPQHLPGSLFVQCI